MVGPPGIPHIKHILTSTPEHCAGRVRGLRSIGAWTRPRPGPAVLLEREHEVERVGAALRSAGRKRGRPWSSRARRGWGSHGCSRRPRAGVGPRPPRPQRAGTELEQGVPVRGRATALRAPAAGADGDERDRWLAGGAGRRRAHRRRPSAPGRPHQAQRPAIPATRGNTACTGSRPTSPPIRSRCWSTTCSGATRSSARTPRVHRPPLEGMLALILAATARSRADARAGDARWRSAAELLRLSPPTEAVGALVAARLSDEPDDRFVRACVDVTGANPFYVGELLDEAARGLRPTAVAAAEIGAIVPRGVANAVCSVWAAGAGSRAALAARAQRSATAPRWATPRGWPDWRRRPRCWLGLVSAGRGPAARSASPTPSCARRSTPTCRPPNASGCTRRGDDLRERGARGQVAAQVMNTEPAADLGAVALPGRARDALALGDAAGAAALFSAPRRASGRGRPPCRPARARRGAARAGAPEAIAPLTEIVERGEDAAAIAAAAIELSGVLLRRRASEGARSCAAPRSAPRGAARAARCRAAGRQLQLGDGSARGRADDVALRDPGGPARDVLQATTLARSPWKRC